MFDVEHLSVKVERDDQTQERSRLQPVPVFPSGGCVICGSTLQNKLGLGIATDFQNRFDSYTQGPDSI